jgi:TonB family protein
MKILPLALLALTAAAHAQDVTFTPPVWLREDAPPEHLPERRHHTMPSYPREVRKSGEIGYVFLERHITAQGTAFAYMTVGSQIILTRAVMDDPWINAMKPAQQGGKPVEADIWYAFIFNPASAAVDGPDASPRLLGITPIFVPSKGKVGSLREHPAVPTRLDIDEKGAVIRAEVESPGDAFFLPAIQESTAHWSFAPARRGGRPVAATISLPVVVSAQPNELFAQGGYRPPHVLKRVRAFYPFALRHLRIRATVIVEFNVDVNGNPQDAAIRSSTNPDFEEEALRTIKQWKFQPATQMGKPVVAHMAMPIVFQFFRDNHDPYQVRGGGQSGLPPEYRYDTPPVVRSAARPDYPYGLMRLDREGSASVEILIDANGKVARTKVLDAAYPELGAALAAALETYQFDPALRDGKPTQSLLKQEMTFRLSETAPDTDHDSLYADYYLLRRVEKDPSSVVSAKQLDHPLHPISRRPPVFPSNLVGRKDHGTALVEIIVDKDGRARIPRIISADDPSFGYAATQAAQFWRFDPPTVGGKAVLTKVQIPFNFAVRKP